VALHRYDLPLVVERLRSVASPGADEGITAAVAILLRAGRDGEAEVFFIERAVREGDPWSGHMAFPGGRRDPTDADPLATAVRETAEEVGIDLTRDASLLARLDDVPVVIRAPAVNLRVAPFVFEMRREVPHALNREVADALWTPVAPLVRGEVSSVYPFRWQGVLHELPCFKLGDRVVWGLTYMMLEGLFRALR
jgi:8-oxo-dGTP pyrophosphatase MutT (NUDIX family)